MAGNSSRAALLASVGWPALVGLTGLAVWYAAVLWLNIPE